MLGLRELMSTRLFELREFQLFLMVLARNTKAYCLVS